MHPWNRRREEDAWTPAGTPVDSRFVMVGVQ